MSPRRTIFAVSLMLGLAVPNANASWLVGADAGLGAPTGSFDDFWSSGFLAGVSANYLASPRLSVGVDVSHTSFGPSGDYQALLDFLDPGADTQFSIWQYGLQGRWLAPMGAGSRLSPYALVGPGFYSVKEKYESGGSKDEVTQTAFGFKVGLGVDYWTSAKFALGVGANYNHTFTSEDDIGHDSTPHFSITGGVRWKPGTSR